MWKNRIAWLLAVLAALGLYLFENNAGTRILLIAAVLAPPLLAAVTLLPAGKLAFRLAAPEEAQRGEEMAIILKAGSRGVLPVPVIKGRLLLKNRLTGETASVPLAFGVSGKRELTLALTAASDHCGLLSLTLEQMAVYDPFGIFCRKLRCDTSARVMVLPQTFPVTISLADTGTTLSDSERYSRTKPGSDPSETFNIREYVPGDPLRCIHWKLSQKEGKLMVRELGLPVVSQVLLLWETSLLPGCAASPEGTDALLSALLSISKALIGQEIPHTVGWQDMTSGRYEERELRGTEDLAELVKLLLANTVQPGAASVVGCWRRSHVRCAYAHAAVVGPYVAPDISSLCGGNRVTALFLSEPGADTSLWQDGARLLPFTVEGLRSELREIEL